MSRGMALASLGGVGGGGIGRLTLGILGGSSSVSPGLTLAFWATRLFQHRADLYRPVPPTHTTDHRAKPSNSYVLAYVDVPCYYVPTDNVNELTPGVGRAKGWNLLTIDGIWLPLGQEIGNSWAIVDRTLLADGITHAATWGSVYTTQGTPRVFNSVGSGIPCGHIQERIFTSPVVPVGVVV